MSKRLDGAGMPSTNYLITSIAGFFFLASTLSMLGQANLSALGISLSDFLGSTWFSLGPLPIEWGFVVSLLAFAGLYIGSSQDLKDYTNHQQLAGIATLLIVLAMGISPDLVTYIGNSTARSGFVVLLLMIGWGSAVKSGGGTK